MKKEIITSRFTAIEIFKTLGTFTIIALLVAPDNPVTENSKK